MLVTRSQVARCRAGPKSHSGKKEKERKKEENTIGIAAQAKKLRERAEELFQAHRRGGGFAAQKNPGTPPETREALRLLKRKGNYEWARANDMVLAASKKVLETSQVLDLFPFASFLKTHVS
jgi:ribosomal protein S8E